jgi:hypothetical protein
VSFAAQFPNPQGTARAAANERRRGECVSLAPHFGHFSGQVSAPRHNPHILTLISVPAAR